MSLTNEQLDLIDATGEVLVETRSDDAVFRTVIWVVVDDGRVYIRSVQGDQGRWYRRALKNPDLALVIGDTRLRFRASPASDGASVTACSRALKMKYPQGRSLDRMLRPQILDTTLLLEPLP